MNKIILVISFVLASAAAACSSDPATNNNPDAGMTTDGGTTETCDPNAGSATVRLLNAPVESGVDVVKKTPRHPGQPGPNGLP